jgi:peptidoglycan/xylan/chitin deacetylase (PgdA/CDA1 family)
MINNQYVNKWMAAVPQPDTIAKKIRSTLRYLYLSLASKNINKNNSSDFLRCIYCHYVFDDQIEKFEKIILALKNIGEFVTTDECLTMLNDNKQIKGNYFHLSFDDGFRNIYKNAYPILLKHSVPAITFLPTKFIDVDWEATAKYCIDIAKYKGVIETLKWNDVREMSKNGYEFGSHTRSHADLSKISDNNDILIDEINGSKSDINIQLNNNCDFFAWPFGEMKHIDDISLEFVRKAGYKACFGAFRGSIITGKTNILRLPRHHFEVEWPLTHIKYFVMGNME